MRLLQSFILTASTTRAHSTIGADVNDIDHPSVGDALLNDDIFLTPCQADHYRKLGFNITDDVTLAGDGLDESCELFSDANPRALQRLIRFWDENFNEDTRKFDVPFYFKSDFDESRKDKIRIKLAEFARDTCVQMVEVSSGDSAFKNKLAIQQDRGCSSYVGRHYSHQMLSLAPGCENSYVPLHEVRLSCDMCHGIHV